MRHIREWVFNLKYADEFARLICALSDPTDKVEFRNAERIRKGWYDYTARQIRRIKKPIDPLALGLGLVAFVKVADRGPRELVEGLRRWKEGIRRAPWSPKLLRAGRIAGHSLTVFGMGLEGYLLYGNLRDRRYAGAAGNVGGIAAGTVTLLEASKGTALLAGAKIGVVGKALGAGTVAFPIAIAAGVGLLGSWLIEWGGNVVADRRVREGNRKALPGLYRTYFKHKDRAEHAKRALDRMASRGG